MNGWNHFLLGSLFMLGNIMLYQDWYGLEDYIKIVRLGWVDLHWSVGFIVSFLSMAVHTYLTDKHRAEK
jgi:hypothetical protein